MQRLRTYAVVGALLAIVIAPLAYAGGLWFGLPVVGGGAYCAGATATGVGPTGGTVSCNSTAPAGPTTTTGQELIPADLNPQGTQAGYPSPGAASSGAQTGYLPLATAASGAYLLTQPTGLVDMTLVVPNGITNVVQNLTGAMTSYGLELPLTPTDGQIVRWTANMTITTIWVTTGVGSTASVNTPTKIVSPFDPLPPALLTSSATIGGVSYLYNLSGNRWFRLQ